MYADDFDGVSEYNNDVYESKCHTNNNNTISLAETTIDIVKQKLVAVMFGTWISSIINILQVPLLLLVHVNGKDFSFLEQIVIVKKQLY